MIPLVIYNILIRINQMIYHSKHILVHMPNIFAV